MSGIVAAHGPFDPRLGMRMLERIAHRGPDGQGSRQVGDAWLGHRRLAIVDPDGGSQPMPNRRGDRWLVGDGHLYNHERLRAEIGEHRFRTRSDHEAALLAYDDAGIDAFDRLWGAFAFVIAGADGSFAAARDSLGAAPLYFAHREQTTVFASELKAFDEDWRPQAQVLPAGHVWTAESGVRAWPTEHGASAALLRGRASDETPPGWVFEALREVLTRAVERCLAADVPVGTFLSGGLDSSVIAAIAVRVAQRAGPALHTFAAGMAGSPDLVAARRVAKFLGTEHHEVVYTAREAIDLVPEVIFRLESFDPSLVHSAVPNYLLARLAREYVKVVIIGEGADELFAGYSHYGEITTGKALHAELLATLEQMSDLGLQRVDRVASANGLEPRIPFLDLDVVELAMALPPAWKLNRPGRREKWLLRRAFEGWLPEDVLWRGKEQFGDGTGMSTVLSEHFSGTVRPGELERERAAVDPPLRTAEELAFYRIFTEALPGVRGSAAVARFVEA